MRESRRKSAKVLVTDFAPKQELIIHRGFQAISGCSSRLFSYNSARPGASTVRESIRRVTIADPRRCAVADGVGRPSKEPFEVSQSHEEVAAGRATPALRNIRTVALLDIH